MLPTCQKLQRRNNFFDGYCTTLPTSPDIVLKIREGHYALRLINEIQPTLKAGGIANFSFLDE